MDLFLLLYFSTALMYLDGFIGKITIVSQVTKRPGILLKPLNASKKRYNK